MFRNTGHERTAAQRAFFEGTDWGNEKLRWGKNVFLHCEQMRSNPVLVFEVVVGFLSLFSHLNILNMREGGTGLCLHQAFLLLQLLCGKLLLHVALVTRHAQVLSDGCHEGHGSAVLLHLSGLLLHVDLVSETEITWNKLVLVRLQNHDKLNERYTFKYATLFKHKPLIKICLLLNIENTLHIDM